MFALNTLITSLGRSFTLVVLVNTRRFMSSKLASLIRM